jgi:hypothetical protein
VQQSGRSLRVQCAGALHRAVGIDARPRANRGSLSTMRLKQSVSSATAVISRVASFRAASVALRWLRPAILDISLGWTARALPRRSIRTITYTPRFDPRRHTPCMCNRAPALP